VYFDNSVQITKASLKALCKYCECYANVSKPTLTAICEDKSLVVLDACGVTVDNIHCKRILDNTQGHLVHMKVCFRCSKLEFDSKFGNVHQTIRLIYMDLLMSSLRLLECNGFTYLKPSRGFKNLLLFKYMSFEDDPPHRFSQFLLF